MKTIEVLHTKFNWIPALLKLFVNIRLQSKALVSFIPQIAGMTSFIFIFTFFASSTTFALAPRGYLDYHVDVYENDVEISSNYQLKPNERFFAICDADKDEILPPRSKITNDYLIIFPSMIWNRTFNCHLSVVDMKRHGRVVLSTGTFKLQTPSYFE